MSLEAVIAKVQKLRRLAGSDNVNEAAAAAAAADKLIQAHGLAEAQIESDNSDKPREAASLDPTSLAEWRKTPAWLMRLSILLVKHYQCACYTEHTRLNSIGCVKMARLRIVGRPSDVASVRYMLGWLTVEIEGLAQRSARGKGRTYANSYRHGAVQGVIAAMREEREAMRTQAKANGQSAALALYDGHAAEAQAALAVAVPKLLKGRKIGGARDGNGYAAGERAGRGIHRGQAGTRALGSGDRTMTTISSKADIRTWVENVNPAGVYGDDGQVAYLVATIQQSNHPPYGTDWSEWLDQQDWIAIAQLGACAVVDCVALYSLREDGVEYDT